MTPKVVSDAEITEEAIQILLEKMPASKVARVLAAWKVGAGDYLADRDRLFVGDTIDSLVTEMKNKTAEAHKPTKR
jgi:N-dimethylarginine dimethylaminohydrolase